MFELAQEFNQPLDKWNVSLVEHLQQMFADALKFNQPLQSWDVSRARSLSCAPPKPHGHHNTFTGDHSQGPAMPRHPRDPPPLRAACSRRALLVFVPSSCCPIPSTCHQPCPPSRARTSFSSYRAIRPFASAAMFVGTTEFNQYLPWDVRSVRTMDETFFYASSFNQLLPWDVRSVESMDRKRRPRKWQLKTMRALPSPSVSPH